MLVKCRGEDHELADDEKAAGRIYVGSAALTMETGKRLVSYCFCTKPGRRNLPAACLHEGCLPDHYPTVQERQHMSRIVFT